MCEDTCQAKSVFQKERTRKAAGREHSFLPPPIVAGNPSGKQFQAPESPCDVNRIGEPGQQHVKSPHYKIVDDTVQQSM